jgi:FG-GAP repeat
LGFKNNLWVLFILSVPSTLSIGLTPEIPTNHIFAQSIDLNINSFDVNKSSNSNFTHNNNLTSKLLFGPELNLSSNMSAAPGSSSLVSSVTNEVKGDFNGDGFDDLAVGVPGEDVITATGTVAEAGAVNVIYGSSSGLSDTILRPQFWTQNTVDVDDVAEANDLFGYSLSAADFNGDGKDDLAIGVLDEDVVTEGGTVDEAGAVNVIYGSPNGLSATSPRPDQFLVQGNEGVSGFAEASDVFGFSLAAADFNGDGKDDLAVGVPFEDVVTATGTITDAGAVNVIYGSSGGLSDTTQNPDQFLVQGFQDVDDVAEANDLFGYSLSAADFNGDGKDDLAMGAASEDVITAAGTVAEAGAVNVIYGSPNGLSATSPEPDQFWTQDTGGIEDVAEAEDIFGFSLVAADFNGDGKDDLSIGVPNEDLSTAETGAVNVIYGSPNGLSATSPRPDQFLVQGNAGVDDVAEANDLFGYSLSAANFNGDKINGRAVDDLAIGVVGEDAVTATGTITDAGAVNVIYGSPNGLSATSPRPDQFLVQGNAGVDDVAETADLFSVSLNADDFNGDGKDDLTIGVYGEDIVTPEGTMLNAGAVNVIYGSPNGLSATSPRPDQFLVQGNAGVDDVTEADDLFGFSLG